MTPQRVFVAMMLFLGLCFGMVHETHAITDCNTACQGGKKPCTLHCELSNGFETTCGVVYPLAADNVSGPLPFRLCRVNQPVISTPNMFSRTRSPLLGCIRAHFSRSTPRSSTSAMV